MELYGIPSTFTRKKRLPRCRYEKSDKKIGCLSKEIIANVKEEVYETYDRILILIDEQDLALGRERFP